MVSEKQLRQNPSHGTAGFQKIEQRGKDEVETALRGRMISLREHILKVIGPLLNKKTNELGEKLRRTAATEG